MGGPAAPILVHDDDSPSIFNPSYPPYSPGPIDFTLESQQRVPHSPEYYGSFEGMRRYTQHATESLYSDSPRLGTNTGYNRETLDTFGNPPGIHTSNQRNMFDEDDNSATGFVS